LLFVRFASLDDDPSIERQSAKPFLRLPGIGRETFPRARSSVDGLFRR